MRLYGKVNNLNLSVGAARKTELHFNASVACWSCPENLDLLYSLFGDKANPVAFQGAVFEKTNQRKSSSLNVI